MSIPHTLMGVLARGERFGYDLRREVEKSLGAEWKLDFGQLYRALASMKAKGWVTFRTEPGSLGPPRKFYRLTKRGSAELDRWLRDQTPRPLRRRDTTHARARLGAVLGAEAGALIVGNDDPLLALLAAAMGDADGAVRFAAEPLGSLAGLIAMHQGRAQIAASHLRDADSGEYNVPFVKHLLPDEPVVLVHLAQREQGLMLAAGNPCKVRGVRDLARTGVRFVNREPGSGTRVFLDQLLRARRIAAGNIEGYARALPTHREVAAAIASGAADAGPGGRAAAEAQGLQFLPLGEERYDLVIPRRLFDSPSLRPLLEALHGTALRRAARKLKGYDVGRIGRVVGRT